MEIILSQTGGNQLITFLKLAVRQQSSIVVKVKENELVFQYIPVDHVNFVSLTLERDNHVKMTNVEPKFYEKPFELASKDLLKILTNIKKQDLLIHSQTDKEGTLLGFNFVIKKADTEEVVKEIQIGIQNLSQEIPKDLKMQYPEDREISFDIDIESFLEKLTELKDYEYEAISFVTDWNTKTLDLLCADDQRRKKVRMVLHDGTDFNFVRMVDGVSIFTLSYLVTLLVAGPAYETVRVVFAEDSPLLMKYIDPEDGRTNLSIMIAPRKTD